LNIPTSYWKQWRPENSGGVSLKCERGEETVNAELYMQQKYSSKRKTK